jgi:hypothetical protein
MPHISQHTDLSGEVPGIRAYVCLPEELEFLIDPPADPEDQGPDEQRSHGFTDLEGLEPL